jgi:hypothetical protein
MLSHGEFHGPDDPDFDFIRRKCIRGGHQKHHANDDQPLPQSNPQSSFFHFSPPLFDSL